MGSWTLVSNLSLPLPPSLPHLFLLSEEPAAPQGDIPKPVVQTSAEIVRKYFL